MIRLLTGVLLATQSFITCNAQPPKIPVEGYKLFWSDDFDGPALDKTKWNYRGLDRSGDLKNFSESVSLDGKGFLLITASAKNDTVKTGMIATENIFQTTYGYFECRSKLTESNGLFPAFWLQSQLNGDYGNAVDNGVELDIFEYFPHERKNQVSHTLHWGGYGPTHKIAGPVWVSLSPTPDGFHTFGLEWTPESYTTFVDGVRTFQGTEHISRKPEFIVLSLGYTSAGTEKNFKTKLPESFVVDYVRVYKKQ